MSKGPCDASWGVVEEKGGKDILSKGVFYLAFKREGRSSVSLGNFLLRGTHGTENPKR